MAWAESSAAQVTTMSSWIPEAKPTPRPSRKSRRNSLLHDVIVRLISAGRSSSVQPPGGTAASSARPGFGAVRPPAYVLSQSISSTSGLPVASAAAMAARAPGAIWSSASTNHT